MCCRSLFISTKRITQITQNSCDLKTTRSICMKVWIKPLPIVSKSFVAQQIPAISLKYSSHKFMFLLHKKGKTIHIIISFLGLQILSGLVGHLLLSYTNFQFFFWIFLLHMFTPNKVLSFPTFWWILVNY